MLQSFFMVTRVHKNNKLNRNNKLKNNNKIYNYK